MTPAGRERIGTPVNEIPVAGRTEVKRSHGTGVDDGFHHARRLTARLRGATIRSCDLTLRDLGVLGESIATSLFGLQPAAVPDPRRDDGATSPVKLVGEP